MATNENLRQAQLVMLEILKKVDSICKKHNLRYFIDWGTLLGAIRHKGFIPWDDDLDISMPREDYEKFLEIAQDELGNDYFLQTPDTDKYYNFYHVPTKIRDMNSRFLEITESGDEKYNQGIYIDVFPLDRAPDSNIIYKLQDIYSFILERCLILEMSYKEFSIQRKIFYPIVYFIVKVLGDKGRAKLERFLRNFGKHSNGDWRVGIEVSFRKRYKDEWIFPLREIEFEGVNVMAPNNPDAILKKYYNNYMELPKEEDRFSHSKLIEVNIK